jgi:hypothetical protein
MAHVWITLYATLPSYAPPPSEIPSSLEPPTPNFQPTDQRVERPRLLPFRASVVRPLHCAWNRR